MIEPTDLHNAVDMIANELAVVIDRLIEEDTKESRSKAVDIQTAFQVLIGYAKYGEDSRMILGLMKGLMNEL